MATNSIIPTINPIYRRPTVEIALGKSRSTLYRNIKSGLLTKPVEIGGDRVGWPANEIEAISKAMIAGKQEDEIKALVVQLEAARRA